MPVPPLERPSDFDRYWQDMRRELRETAPSYRVESETTAESPARPMRPVRVARVSYASLGGKMPTGWLFQSDAYTRTSSEPARHRALLFLPGYSTTCASPLVQRVLTQIAAAGFTVLAIDPRGQGESRSQHAPSTEGKLVTDILTPETYIYRGVVADCVQAARLLTEITGAERIGAFGHSQGGGLALLTASLAPEYVGAVGCMIPFLTHFAHSLSERPETGPYREVSDFAAGLPAESTDLVRLRHTLGLLDTLHHAPRVQAPVLISVGLKDTTCPPETVYALFDRLTGIKSLLVLPDIGHEHSPEFYPHELAWFRRFLRENSAGDTLEQLDLG